MHRPAVTSWHGQRGLHYIDGRDVAWRRLSLNIRRCAMVVHKYSLKLQFYNRFRQLLSVDLCERIETYQAVFGTFTCLS